jgi:hypothetical protein
MWKSVLRVTRSLAAVAVGYAVIVALTTLAFEKWLGGVTYLHSRPQVLALAALSAVVAGLAGGYAAALIAGRAPLVHGAGVVLFLIVDTTYVLLSGISKDPVWYDLVGGLTLIGSCLCGAWLERWRLAAAHAA